MKPHPEYGRIYYFKTPTDKTSTVTHIPLTFPILYSLVLLTKSTPISTNLNQYQSPQVKPSA